MNAISRRPGRHRARREIAISQGAEGFSVPSLAGSNPSNTNDHSEVSLPGSCIAHCPIAERNREIPGGGKIVGLSLNGQGHRFSRFQYGFDA